METSEQTTSELLGMMVTLILILDLQHRRSIDKNSVVVDHLYDGHTEVAADAKGDAEAQTAEDGDNVALG